MTGWTFHVVTAHAATFVRGRAYGDGHSGDVSPLEVFGLSAAAPGWIVDPSTNPAVWVVASRISSFWDAILVTALSLLIAGLVGIRLVHHLSRSDHGISVPVTLSTGRDAADSPDEPPVSSGRPFDHVVSASTPSKLLSDEGEVIKLLVENEGEIRQHRITDETGWSKSKVSRIVSQMHEDGMIEKRSAGRENVISLTESPSETDQTPDLAQSLP